MPCQGGFKSKCNKNLMHCIRLQAQPSQVLGIDLNGLAPAQRHPGTPIELIGNAIQIFLAIAAQIGSLGELLAQQAVGVFVASPLPGAIGVTEVHLHAGVVRELLVLGHLPASVVGEGFAHGRGNGA